MMCLGGWGACALEQGVPGVLGVPSASPQVGAAPGAAVRAMHSKAGLLLLVGFFYYYFSDE